MCTSTMIMFAYIWLESLMSTSFLNRTNMNIVKMAICSAVSYRSVSYGTFPQETSASREPDPVSNTLRQFTEMLRQSSAQMFVDEEFCSAVKANVSGIGSTCKTQHFSSAYDLWHGNTMIRLRDTSFATFQGYI